MVNTSFSGIPRAGSSNLASGTTAGARGIIIAMTTVIVGLGGFYGYLNQKQSRKEALGTNARHERRLAHPGTGDRLTEERLATLIEDGRNPLPPIIRDNKSGHATIEQYKASGKGPEFRYMQPAPQRGRGDNSGKAYTKSPDYVKSYEKVAMHWKAKDGKDVDGETSGANGNAY